MAAVAEVTITPGTGKFDPEDQRWADQVTLLADDLREAAGSVSRRRIPEPGAKGAVGEVILALGSAGAVTAAVECFRAWLRRDKTRSLTVTWADGEGAARTTTVTGENIDQASFQALAEAIGEALGG
ncbi:MAG: effector-associated constant component EACC1 [Pseudonocardiaceae bacterium]